MNCEPKLVPVQTPRNRKQLRNLMKTLINSSLSRDDLYSLHEIAYDIPGFVWKINMYPDMVCICGLQEILDDANKIIMFSHISIGRFLCFSPHSQTHHLYTEALHPYIMFMH